MTILDIDLSKGLAGFLIALWVGNSVPETLAPGVPVAENGRYRLIVRRLIYILAMSAIKWQVRFVDCSLIYADLRRLFIFMMFEFLRHEFGAAEKSQGAAEKNKEKSSS